MKITIFYLILLHQVYLSCTSSSKDWSENMDKLLEVAKQYESSRKPKLTKTAGGLDDWGVKFEGTPKTASVHTLRPQDISVIGALGDSITAANGADAEYLPGVAKTYRGVSWSVGGDGTIDDTMTLTNILRKFNPEIKGFSTGTGISGVPEIGSFNVAVPGARAEDIPDQAHELIRRLKAANGTEIDYEHDWKILTIFIGGNDLCDLSDDDSRPDKYIEKLKEGLDVLHAELPRTLVNVIEILEIYLLPQVRYGFGSTPQCGIVQQIECPYVAQGTEEELEFVKTETWEYQRLTQELLEKSGRYDTRDDFTVVNQPFFRNTMLPYTEKGEVDATFFAPDCFHFSTKGHGMGAINLWNNMLEPVGNKTTEWGVYDLKVPTDEHPYIFTNKNSKIEETPNVAPQSCKNSDIPVWVIAVMSILAAGLLIEAIVLICLNRKSKTIMQNKMGNSNDSYKL